jgi:hypothetical protein
VLLLLLRQLLRLLLLLLRQLPLRWLALTCRDASAIAR